MGAKEFSSWRERLGITDHAFQPHPVGARLDNGDHLWVDLCIDKNLVGGCPFMRTLHCCHGFRSSGSLIKQGSV